jgi:hypothetical protein
MATEVNQRKTAYENAKNELKLMIQLNRVCILSACFDSPTDTSIAVVFEEIY